MMMPASVEHRRKASWFVPGRGYDYKLIPVEEFPPPAAPAPVAPSTTTEEE
jgi:hypothetical protein